MNNSDTDEHDIPSMEVCDARCNQFAEITSTDTALAMFYLQDTKWDLEVALDVYWKANEGSVESTGNTSRVDAVGSEVVAAGDGEVDPAPRRVRLLSWNIDGLDDVRLETRTRGVCETIRSEDPDVVFLQEVVPLTVDIIRTACPGYRIIASASEDYFTAMMLKTRTVTYDDHKVKPFAGSLMGRCLLSVTAKVKGVECLLMTSHLESTAAHGTERKRQLQAAFKAMQVAPPQLTVFFGGDLNLRDKEVAELGGLPADARDVWETTGRRAIARYTWDTTRNDNLGMPGRARCRFDRLYTRAGGRLKPVYFELSGLRRLAECKRFPSDHWAILAHLDVV